VQDYEKLGAFYLGRRFDPESGRVLAEPLLYDARDLVTHAVIVGMTGSGKTGLAVDLIEEAVLDGIPVLAIDPKGDLGNLMLAFPDLAPADFRPWLDPAEAAREGRSLDEHAEAVARRWREGLAAWDQGPERVARFAAAERVLYTPGSTAGRPLAALRSFAPPPPALLGDADALREKLIAAAASLLGLAGVEGDPLRSREHVLVSTLLERAWREGRALDLVGLIREVQRPPLTHVGALELETFFPAAERARLALALNNLAASPAFAAWTAGDPLDVAALLHGPDGRPRLSIVSIAHLSDAERMFAVTLLLSEVVAWMRTQRGTSSLRALLYMDEVFGFFPPVANPPAKEPMLTLLKQARAFGLGVVLATQNPVDLDYKGLANAGTWFLGRLQTERDKRRVLEGLEGTSGAGARLDRARADALLSNLPPRTFLMLDAHEDEPVAFQTRWALSYLAGPLTREQIRMLAQPAPPADGETGAAPAAATPATAAAVATATAATAPAVRPGEAPAAGERPLLPGEIEERFLEGGAGATLRPALLGIAALHYRDAKVGVDVWEDVAWLAPLDDDAVEAPWDGARELPDGLPALASEPPPGARFAPLPAAAHRPASYARWQRELASHLRRARPLRLLRCPRTGLVSAPGESEGAFRARIREALHEARDAERERLQERYAPKLARLRERIARAEEREAREREQVRDHTLQAAISIGASVVGALFGRKLGSVTQVERAGRAVRRIGRAAGERDDVARAREQLEAAREEEAELDRQLKADLARIETLPDVATLPLEERQVAPQRSDVEVRSLWLVWVPAG
jgi:DNA helicase HerA-like ATPase